jgi:hypothetical protein
MLTGVASGSYDLPESNLKDKGKDMEKAWRPAIVLFSLLAAAYAAIDGLKPPRPLSENAPPAEFSAVRAAKHLETIAIKPHAVGSVAHDEVRDLLISKWRELGFEPEVQNAAVTDEKRGIRTNVQNVLVRMKGTGSAKALMLAAHYDTTRLSFGAADDGAAVAAFLETARALKAGPPLKNDIIFLITDGEEVALLGARAFVFEHPWAADVGLVLNFEARGTSGPSVMFETSRGNTRLIREFAQASPFPRANSLAVTIYRLMPNSTDLTVFMAAGMPGMNFAFIGGPQDYHTPMDSLAHLDLSSLQHHRSYALALARHFGNSGIPEKETSDAVYFNIIGSVLVRYSQATAFVLASLAAGLLILAGVLGLRRKALCPKNIARCGAFALAGLVLIPALLILFSKTIGLSHGTWLPAGNYGANAFYLAALILLALAIFLLLFRLFRSHVGWPDLAFAAAVTELMVTFGLALVLPGVSFLTGVPVLFSAAALTSLFTFKQENLRSQGKTWIVILASVPAVLVFVPLISLFFTAMGLNLIGTAGLSVLLVLLFWTLIPAFELVTAGGKAAWVLAAAIGFLGFASAGALTTRYSERHPRPTEYGVFHRSDGDICHVRPIETVAHGRRVRAYPET